MSNINPIVKSGRKKNLHPGLCHLLGVGTLESNQLVCVLENSFAFNGFTSDSSTEDKPLGDAVKVNRCPMN